jgi:tRNA-dihydrouridine synthase
MNKLILGSMENYTDISFRLLCQKYGANLTITEMTSPIAISRENPRSLNRIYIPKQEKNGYIQLMGTANKEIFKGISKTVELIETGENNSKGIDFNFGCPSKNINENKAGSYLLKYPKTIKKIINNVSKICPYSISCKLRLGYEKEEEIFNILKEINDCELNFIIIHGRTKAQGYSGKANWDILEKIRNKANFPVYGNGDINSYNEAQEKFKQGWKGISIARSARGNPGIFSNINPNKKQFLEYLKLAKKFNCLELQKAKIHLMCFETNKQKKLKISEIKTIEELLRFTNEHYLS